jgi:hypothetical protein
MLMSTFALEYRNTAIPGRVKVYVLRYHVGFDRGRWMMSQKGSSIPLVSIAKTSCVRC